MDKERYIAEIGSRLQRHFSASRDGYKIPAVDRHRLEGFIQGAIFMGFASSKELAVLMEDVHYSIFGMTIKEREVENNTQWRESEIDYSSYDPPAYERNRR